MPAAVVCLVRAMAGIATGAATTIADVSMTQPQRDNFNTLLATNWQ